MCTTMTVCSSLMLSRTVTFLTEKGGLSGCGLRVVRLVLIMMRREGPVHQERNITLMSERWENGPYTREEGESAEQC